MNNFFDFNLKTVRRNEIVDITREVNDCVKKSGIQEGICVVHVPHTTAGVTINENADPAVKRDILKHFAEMVPPHHDFDHSEGNSDSHIKTTMTGPSLTLIIHSGHLVLGTWQGIMFCEYDGPRNRHYFVKCISD